MVPGVRRYVQKEIFTERAMSPRLNDKQIPPSRDGGSLLPKHGHARSPNVTTRRSPKVTTRRLSASRTAAASV